MLRTLENVLLHGAPTVGVLAGDRDDHEKKAGHLGINGRDCYGMNRGCRAHVLLIPLYA